MKSLLRSRIDKHFATVSALVAAAAIGGAVREASATIVYSGIVNMPVANNVNGLYLNLATGLRNAEDGSNGAAAVPGWDINIYFGVDFYGFGNPGYTYVAGVGGVAALTAGATIDPTTCTAVGSSGSTGFTPGQAGLYYGFSFQNENAGNAIQYGWAQYVQGVGGGPGTVIDYAYDDSGAGILAGATSSDPNDGACCLPSGVCSMVLAADCASAGGSFTSAGTTCAAAGCAARCCFPDGTCQMLSPTACTGAGGVSTAGQNCTSGPVCPQAGACCRNDGTCSIQLNAAACTSAGGGYQGDGTTCASAACGAFTVVNTVAGTFTEISGSGTPLTVDFGSIDDGDASMVSSVTNALVTNASLYACTNGYISDTQAFDTYVNTALPETTTTAGFALFPNWDDLYVDSPGVIYHQGLVENGVNVEVIEWSQVRTFTNGTTGARGTFEVKIFAPGGPGLAQYIFSGDDSWDWNGNSSTVGVQWNTNKSFQYAFNNTNVQPNPPFPIPDGSVFTVVGATTGPTCYANCDHSTALPFLNVVDFTCFLQKFAAADPYANCDGSTQIPTLNVVDFTCFLQKFAAGCSAP